MASPFDSLRVSFDPRTVEAAVGRAKVRAIEGDGSLVFEDGLTRDKSFEEALERIWNEYPGGLSNLTEEELLIKEDGDLAEPVKDVEEVESAPEEQGTMKPEEMEAVRSDIFVKLNDARNELWFVLELAKSLAVSSPFTADPPPPPIPQSNPTSRKPSKGKPVPDASDRPIVAAAGANEPPVLPPGTYSITPSLPPTTLTYQEIFELEQALAAKQEALEECSKLIDTAVTELQTMNEASDKFWEKVRRLKNGASGREQWAVLPRPDFGRTMADGEKARDIIIPYAIDEAPAGIRASSLAAFDLDPAKVDEVAFGARAYRRLRVTMTTPSGTASSIMSTEADTDIATELEAAQLEALDEELFQELRGEASRLGIELPESDAILVSLGEFGLIFEILDTRKELGPQTKSPACEIVLHSARHLLLWRHRQRKAAFLEGRTGGSATYILERILGVLRLTQTVQDVEPTLRVLVSAVRASGLVAAHSVQWSGLDGSAAVLDPDRFDLSAEMTIDLAGCKGLTMTVPQDANPSVVTSLASFPLRAVSDLPRILAQDLARQMLSYVHKQIIESLEAERRDSVLLDELEGVVVLPDGAHLRIALIAPYDRLESSLISMPGPPDVYKQEDGKTLVEWARDLTVGHLDTSA